MSKSVSKRSAAVSRRAGGPPLSAVLGRGDLGSSLLYVFPLFLVYGIGVLSTPSMNGVDFITRYLFAAVGYSTTNYLLVYVGLTVLFGGTLLHMRKRGLLHRLPFLSLVLESAIVALTLGSFIVFVMQSILGVSAATAAPALALGQNGAVTDIVLSFGAGVHEELVFRLGVFSVTAALLRVAFRTPHLAAMLIAAVISSLLFSAAHHVGALGEAWQLNVFVYRTIAGLAFAAIYYFRSLAHAVYSHALYDVYVGVVLG